MTPDRIKIIFIAGSARSGSTLLGSIISQRDGYFHVGELSSLWGRGLLRGRSCACGKPIAECEFWSEVLRRAFGDLSPEQIGKMKKTLGKLRGRHVLMLLLPSGKERLAARWGAAFDQQARLYAAIQEVSGCRVIVDSSKSPLYATLLALMPSVALSVAQTVRDPRAVAYSWFRKGQRKAAARGKPADRPMRFPRRTLMWLRGNLLIELLFRVILRPHTRIRYEDFIASPQPALDSVFRLADEPVPDQPLVDDHTVAMKRQHTAMGNRVIYGAEHITLRLDTEWQSKMGWLPRMLVWLQAWPLMLKYGYFVPASRAADE